MQHRSGAQDLRAAITLFNRETWNSSCLFVAHGTLRNSERTVLLVITRKQYASYVGPESQRRWRACRRDRMLVTGAPTEAGSFVPND